VPAISAATGKVLSTGSPVDDGHRLANCDTSLVVSGGVNCGRWRRNVYDKTPQRYAKDNRTAHLTARSDKSVAYVTDNKRLYSTFCTVEANYWQTRSIARPLCNVRATCLDRLHELLDCCFYISVLFSVYFSLIFSSVYGVIPKTQFYRRFLLLGFGIGSPYRDFYVQGHTISHKREMWNLFNSLLNSRLYRTCTSTPVVWTCNVKCERVSMWLCAENGITSILSIRRLWRPEWRRHHTQRICWKLPSCLHCTSA